MLPNSLMILTHVLREGPESTSWTQFQYDIFQGFLAALPGQPGTGKKRADNRTYQAASQGRSQRRVLTAQPVGCFPRDLSPTDLQHENSSFSE